MATAQQLAQSGLTGEEEEGEEYVHLSIGPLALPR